MPDITICTNNKCPLRRLCYRFTAKPNKEWQSYGLFEPVKMEDGNYCCEMFILKT